MVEEGSCKIKHKQGFMTNIEISVLVYIVLKNSSSLILLSYLNMIKFRLGSEYIQIIFQPQQTSKILKNSPVDSPVVIIYKTESMLVLLSLSTLHCPSRYLEPTPNRK